MFNKMVMSNNKNYRPIAKFIIKPTNKQIDSSDSDSDNNNITQEVEQDTNLRDIILKCQYIRLKPTNDINRSKEMEIPSSVKDLIYSPLYTFQGDKSDKPCHYYVCGPTLCGKSYISSVIIEDYNSILPDNRVYMVSALESDPNYDKVKNFYRLDPSTFLDDMPDISEFENSITIFDDIDSFADKNLTKAVNGLRDSLLMAGRHRNTSVLSLAQVALNGKKSQNLLINASTLIFFPNGGGRKHAHHILKEYIGMDNDLITRVLNLPTRWLIINRVFPLYILHERGTIIV
jgi:hypothetical protein